MCIIRNRPGVITLLKRCVSFGDQPGVKELVDGRGDRPGVKELVDGRGDKKRSKSWGERELLQKFQF